MLSSLISNTIMIHLLIEFVSILFYSHFSLKQINLNFIIFFILGENFKNI